MVDLLPTWRRKWQPTPVFLLGKSHGRKILVGYSPWGCKESDTTEWLYFFISLPTSILNGWSTAFYVYLPLPMKFSFIISIFLLVFCFFFPLKRISFNISYRSSLMLLNSLSFCLSVEFFLSSSNLMKALPDRVFLVLCLLTAVGH